MKNITFLVFNSFDNSSYCQDYYCTSYKDATEQHLGYITGHSNNMGKITHDNVIAWEEGNN